jgi:AcrR family transcriptional regulator
LQATVYIVLDNVYQQCYFDGEQVTKSVFNSLQAEALMKEQIMAAAISLFARYGYKKTTIDDIARELHIAKANIYRHFANKEDLYHQAVSSVLDAYCVLLLHKGNT